MIQKKMTILLIIGILLFIASLSLGVVFNALAVWNDLEGMSFWGHPEGSSFDSSIEAGGTITRLNCPVLLTSRDLGKVTATIKNPKDTQSKTWIQASISKPGEPDNLIRNRQELMLEPAESVSISWQVDKSNKLFDRVIYVRVFLFQTQYHPPSATKHCGIIIKDIGKLSGNQAIALITGTSLLGMALGTLLWWWGSSAQMRLTNRIVKIMISLIGITVLTTLTNLAGWMLFAGILFILMILLLVSIFEAILLNK